MNLAIFFSETRISPEGPDSPSVYITRRLQTSGWPACGWGQIGQLANRPAASVPVGSISMWSPTDYRGRCPVVVGVA